MPGLGDLTETLVSAGLGEFIASFNPLRPRQMDWFTSRERAPERLRPLLDLFLLNREIEIETLPLHMFWVPEELVRHGLASVFGGASLRLTQGLVLLPVLGRWLFCNPPGTGAKYYMGDDSIALMLRVMPRVDATVLDLCTGSGLQALHCAGFARHVTAVEKDNEIVALARVNVLLNRLQNRIEIHQGDLFDPVAGRRFDMVIANPPLLPFPSGLPDLSIGHGGNDGMRVAARIIQGLPDAMTPDGRAHIISTCLTNSASDHVHTLAAGLARDHGLDVGVSILSMQDLTGESDYLEAIVRSVAAEISVEPETVRQAYQGLLAESEATHLSFLFVLVTHGNGRFTVTDLCVPGSRGPWQIDLV